MVPWRIQAGHLSWLVLVLVLGCGGGVSQAEYDSVVKEKERLERELINLTQGPTITLQRARTGLNNSDFRGAKAEAERLIKDFPGSPEAAEAPALIALADAGLAKLEREVARAEAERKREVDRAMAGMVKSRDEIRGLTVWRDRAAPRFVNSRSWVGAYIMDPDEGAPYLRFTIYYLAEDWLFTESYRFLVDGKRFEFNPPDFGDDAVERDNGDSKIWEWWDVHAVGDRLAVLQALSEAKVATIRYVGKQYHRDRVIGSAEREATKRTLLAFEILSKQ
jgi:hypothetical protein